MMVMNFLYFILLLNNTHDWLLKLQLPAAPSGLGHYLLPSKTQRFSSRIEHQTSFQPGRDDALLWSRRDRKPESC